MGQGREGNTGGVRNKTVSVQGETTTPERLPLAKICVSHGKEEINRHEVGRRGGGTLLEVPNTQVNSYRTEARVARWAVMRASGARQPEENNLVGRIPRGVGKPVRANSPRIRTGRNMRPGRRRKK